jgi:hypothetical protein
MDKCSRTLAHTEITVLPRNDFSFTILEEKCPVGYIITIVLYLLLKKRNATTFAFSGDHQTNGGNAWTI